MRPLFTLLLCCMAFVASAQQHWLGLVTAANLPITLTYDTACPSSHLMLTSPTQSGDTLFASQFEWQGAVLTAQFAEGDIRLKLYFDSTDRSLRGTFRQRGIRQPLHMWHTDTLFRASRPQTPTPPYAFDTVAVSYRYCADGDSVAIHGTLTLPRGVVGRCPVAILVSGSGQQDRNETLYRHQPFLVIADHFARHGIATLRYDDRGVGASKGPLAEATTYDFYRDAYGMLQSLQRLSDSLPIDPHRIGIVGHSEGAYIGQLLASKHRREVAFLVMLGGQGYDGASILLQQNEALLRLNGIADSLVAVRVACMTELFSTVEKVSPRLLDSVFAAVVERHAGHLNNEQRKAIGMRAIDVSMWCQQLSLPWMRHFVSHTDPRRTLPKVKCPMLALNGEKDCQVLPINLGAIGRLTRGRADTQCLPDLNHLFQHCATGLPTEYPLIDETFAPEALQLITEWILTHTR